MNEFDDDLPEEVPDFDSEKDEDDESPIKRELLTIRLFKEAVKKARGNEGDRSIIILSSTPGSMLTITTMLKWRKPKKIFLVLGEQKK